MYSRFEHWERVFARREARKEAKKAIRYLARSGSLVPHIPYDEEPVVPPGLVSAEREFFNAARERGFRPYRNGWPDFLIERPSGFIGVEVKIDSDTINERQHAMFAALERAGVDIFIWNPANSKKLIPWRKYLKRQHRTRNLRRVGYPSPE